MEHVFIMQLIDFCSNLALISKWHMLNVDHQHANYIYVFVSSMQAAIYPGNVLALNMTKPPGFNYKSGMYIFLQCPEISPFEW
jgi:hypothetical protein